MIIGFLASVAVEAVIQLARTLVDLLPKRAQVHKDRGLLLDQVEHRVKEDQIYSEVDYWIIVLCSSSCVLTQQAGMQVGLRSQGDSGA